MKKTEIDGDTVVGIRKQDVALVVESLAMIQDLTVGLLCILLISACTPQGAWDLFKDLDQPTMTASFQDGLNGYAGTKDAHLVEWHSGNNTGANDRVEATKHTGITPTDNKAIVIEFDLSSIPTTATVIDADLALFLIEQRNGSIPKTLNVHKITGAWTEGAGTGIDGEDVAGVDWNSMPTFDAPSIHDQLIGTVLDTWHTFSLASVAQGWVSTPSSNFGVILKEDSPSDSDGTKVFASSEYATFSSRPMLIVSYTD